MKIMTAKNSKNAPNLSIGSVILLAIFLVGFFIRTYAALKINFTEYEAAYVLGFDGYGSYTPSVLQNLINKLFFQLPDYTPFSLRLFSILAGSLIIILPYFFREKLGNGPAIICALFFAFDPFLIANSVLITGNTFVLLAAGLMLVAWENKQSRLVLLFIFLMTVLGRGFAYFLIVFTVCLSIYTGLPGIRSGFKEGLEKLNSEKLDRITLAFVLVVFIILFILSSTHQDIFVADLSAFIENLTRNYPVGNSPFIYPITLLVYIPLGVVLAVLFLIIKPVPLRKVLSSLVLAGVFFLILIMFFPGHRVVDLVWVSTPIWVVSAVSINRIYSLTEARIKRDFIFQTLLLVSIGNLILSLFSLTYRYRFGLSLTNNLASIFTIIVFMITLVIYWAYLCDIRIAIGGLGISFLIILLVAQFSATSRTAGFPGFPEREIFWDGYFPDKALIEKLIKTSIGNQIGTIAPADFWVDREISPEVFWDLGENRITRQAVDEDPQRDYKVIFRTDEGGINLSGLHFGQKFLAKSYPAWMNTPLSSVFGNDFWMWYFFRDSQQHQEFNYLWLSVQNNS